MKTLYVRIVLTFVAIAFVSGIVGLALTSLYYQERLRTNNEVKALEMGRSIGELYEEESWGDLDSFLKSVAVLGFQIYAVDESMQGRTYGRAFKHGKLSEEAIRSVLAGNVYHGMQEENSRLKIFSYFENSLRNTAGIPLRTDRGTVALFIRSDLEMQIGDIRVIVAILLGVTFVSSLVLIVFFTRLIVKPLNVLKKATKQIGKGDFNVELDNSRRRKDEIGDLAGHFAEMADSMGRLDRMRQEFVANVSHEFQTPLTSIQGFARAIRDKETTQAQTEHYAEVIERESRRLSSLSAQLLRLASLDREERKLNISVFRLDEQIRNLLITMEWQWSEKSLNLELELPDTTIAADAELLHEVWMNLITNGIRYTDSGGTIGVEIRAEDDKEIAVEVRDTGCGISENELPFVFERFHKADKARDRSESGSGLGLAIARKIVESHGGAIEVRSEIGAGTSFLVRLPSNPIG